MRCLACDVALSDSESVRKNSITGEFVDLCNKCYSTIQSEVNNDPDIQRTNVVNDEE